MALGRAVLPDIPARPPLREPEPVLQHQDRLAPARRAHQFPLRDLLQRLDLEHLVGDDPLQLLRSRPRAPSSASRRRPSSRRTGCASGDTSPPTPPAASSTSGSSHALAEQPVGLPQLPDDLLRRVPASRHPIAPSTHSPGSSKLSHAADRSQGVLPSSESQAAPSSDSPATTPPPSQQTNPAHPTSIPSNYGAFTNHLHITRPPGSITQTAPSRRQAVARPAGTDSGVDRQRPVRRNEKRVIGHERPALPVPRAFRLRRPTSLPCAACGAGSLLSRRGAGGIVPSALPAALCGTEGGNPEMLVAASKRGPTLITRGHEAGLGGIAAGTGDFRIARFRQRRSPPLPIVRSGGRRLLESSTHGLLLRRQTRSDPVDARASIARWVPLSFAISQPGGAS